jgi:hypothetical protein
MPRILYLYRGQLARECVPLSIPSEEMEAFADEEERRVAGKEGLPGARDILIGRISTGTMRLQT